ncbi:MAG TPA: coenzyme F420-0:L-glutamate ligase [Methanothrix sp.]|nr:coenzyme F420-0:L-glutamate ligase [Methanothrix sp.]
MQVLGIKTDLIKPGDDLADKLEKAMNDEGLALQDGDILVVSESTLATAEGRIVSLDRVDPSSLARLMADKYDKDPREMQLILEESDQIVGGIPGVVLTLREGFLYPNAGIDNSNAPPGSVVLFPSDPLASASRIRERLAKGGNIAVIIGDSRTHPLRLGCVGVALACAGLDAVEDARGQKDLFGRELKITRKAVADNLVSAAQIVMGEGDEGIPAAIIRNAPLRLSESAEPIPSIPPQDCMYMGALGCSCTPRPYTGGYDALIDQAKEAMKEAYAPYSGFKVGAALLGRSGRIYCSGNIENAASGAGICAERAALARAVASGEKEFEAVAVVGTSEGPVSPCGLCRQSLMEFGEDITVIMSNSAGEAIVAKLADLLPAAFTGRCINKI